MEILPGDDRHICGANTPIGEIDRCRRLGCTANTNQHDIRLIKLIGVSAIIMRHKEIHGIDAPKIGRIHIMLTAGPMRLLTAEMRTEHIQHCIKHGRMWQLLVTAMFFKLMTQLTIHHRVEHNARMHLHRFEHALQMAIGADKRMNMLNRPYTIELGTRRLGDRVQCLPG